MLILLFAGASGRYTSRFQTRLRQQSQFYEAMKAHEMEKLQKCLVCCRIPIGFQWCLHPTPELPGTFGKRETFKVFTFLKVESEDPPKWGRFILGVIRVPKRLHPHPSEDTTRVISRSVSKMATDRSACASTSRLTNAGEVKSALAAFYEFHMRLKPHYVSV
jgi:hypothetical protein